MYGKLTALALGSLLVFAVTDTAAIEKVTIGNTKTIVRTVTGTLEKNRRRLELRDDVYHNEVIETKNESATEIIFLDETTITLGPNTRMTLDRFVFDTDPNKAAFVMTAARGALRFVSGNMPKKSYVIHTPSATIGIRGTILTIVTLPLESMGRIGVFAVNITVQKGEAEVTNCAGARILLNRPGMSTTITGSPGGACSVPTPPGKQPARFSSHLGELGPLR